MPSSSAITSHKPPFPHFGSIERLDPAIDRLVPPGAALEMLAEGFVWTEGPVWIEDQAMLLFSDIPPNRIYRWTSSEGISLFMEPSGYSGTRTDIPEPGSNGLCLDLEGRLLLAEHGNRRIARLDSLSDPNGSKTTIADNFDGKRFNSPNDLIVASNGDLYFTDPPYGLAGQMDDPEKELDYQGIYRVQGQDRTVTLLATQTRPNGIGLSPDERTLYVSNSDPQQCCIYAYDRLGDGTLDNPRVFFDADELAASGRPGLPDGMTTDSAGNLWATGPGGVLVIDRFGRHLGTVNTGEATANVVLNPDESTLFFTANRLIGMLQLR